ncbi:hypothetical protein ADN00_14725 [Ornatilinea apprima]|uniref:Restriction endonuclease NgoMIV n=1 Tax=Ornatilinea apprima TaxID=1134406 RepID=A0A0P6XFJ3_9CHLR|nr:NgoMIV family type II restriction endonuclease [Ornatilinea apprima]KPL73591.1 hypothetical protein ADN00_14725 [Ornatilinea apprima]
MLMENLRKEYHKKIGEQIIRIYERKGQVFANFADGDSKISTMISLGILDQMEFTPKRERISEQSVGDIFEVVTKEYLESSFELLGRIRPGKWLYQTAQTSISNFDQYEHLQYLKKLVSENQALKSAIGGDYIVRPDIVISRIPISLDELNCEKDILDNQLAIASHSPLLAKPDLRRAPILHASISCKWTLRSDRAQGTRTEALNLIRNRKGNQPHIVAVTAEPLPNRIATLALGTGDIDCVYHFALYELVKAIQLTDRDDLSEFIQTMIEGKRLRDISDLPFDLAI